MGRLIFGKGAGVLASSVGKAALLSGGVGAAQQLGQDEVASHYLSAGGYGDLSQQYSPTWGKEAEGALNMMGMHIGSSLMHEGLAQGFSANASRKAAVQVAGDVSDALQGQTTGDQIQQLPMRRRPRTCAGPGTGRIPEFCGESDGRHTAAKPVCGRQTFAQMGVEHGLTDQELQQKMPDVAGQLRDAVESGGMVKIPGGASRISRARRWAMPCCRT